MSKTFFSFSEILRLERIIEALAFNIANHIRYKGICIHLEYREDRNAESRLQVWLSRKGETDPLIWTDPITGNAKSEIFEFASSEYPAVYLDGSEFEYIRVRLGQLLSINHFVVRVIDTGSFVQEENINTRYCKIEIIRIFRPD